MKIWVLMLSALLICASVVRTEEAQPEMVLQIGHLGQITDLSYAPDGKIMASAARGVDNGFGQVKLWNVKTGWLQRDLQGVATDVNCVNFSPDGKRLLTASLRGTTQIWDAQTGVLRHTFTEQNGVGGTLFFDADTLVSAGGYGQPNGEVFLWDANTGKRIRTLSGAAKPTGAMDFETVRPALALSRNRQFLVDATPSSARIWRTDNWKLARTFSFPQSSVKAVVLSADGQTLIVGLARESGSIRFYDVATGKLKRGWEIPNGQPTSLALSPDSRTLIGSLYGGGGMGLVRWWRTDNGKEIRTQKAHQDDAELVEISPDGAVLATGAGMWDASVKFWNASTGQLKTQTAFGSDDVDSLVFAPQSHILGVAQADTTVRFWDVERGVLVRTIHNEAKDHAGVGDVNALAFSPDNETLAVGGGRNFNLHLWKWKTGQRGPKLDFKRDLPHSIAFSPDGEFLAATGAEAKSFVWNPKTGALLHTLLSPKPQSAVSGATAFSPNGEFLATGGGSTVDFWNPKSGALLFSLPQSSARTLQFSSDGAFLVVATWTDNMRIYEVATRKLLWEKYPILDFAWAPDAQFLWIRNQDGTVSRHAARDGKTLQSWKTQTGNQRVSVIDQDSTAWLTLSDDGKFLVGKNDENAIKLWDAQSGRLFLTFRTLPTPWGTVSQDWIAFTPDGHYRGSKNCERWIRWRVGDELFSGDQYASQFRRPALEIAD